MDVKTFSFLWSTSQYVWWPSWALDESKRSGIVENSFTSQTAVFSPKSDYVIGSLSATYSGGIRSSSFLGDNSRVGDYYDIFVLSPKEIEVLVKEVSEKCMWSETPDLSDWSFPSTGTENVRALNKSVLG